jgi:excisionase family DNA binding protein
MSFIVILADNCLLVDRGKETAMNRPTVTIMQACAIVNVSRRTIYNWIALGKVEHVRTAGGHIRIFSDTLWRGPIKLQPEAALTAP